MILGDAGQEIKEKTAPGLKWQSRQAAPGRTWELRRRTAGSLSSPLCPSPGPPPFSRRALIIEMNLIIYYFKIILAAADDHPRGENGGAAPIGPTT